LWIAIDNAVFALVRWSVLISLAQIFVLVALVVQYGTAPLENNPYFGPSVNVLIQFGAKDGELIIKDEEYWRLLSAIILHAGVYHLLSKIALQLLMSD
jgi:membrane associated rhomboid family serine protease